MSQVRARFESTSFDTEVLPERTSSKPWSIVREAGIAWLGTRIGFAILTYFAVVYGSQYSTVGLQRTWILGAGVKSPVQFLKAWLEWDAGWYAMIVEKGYDKQSTAFFPLFPLLTRLLESSISWLPISEHTAVLIAGLTVANISALIAFIVIAVLAADVMGNDRVGLLTLAMLLAFPYAFFLTAPYTEATFLAAAAVALFCARRGLWVPAVLAAYLAGLSRSTGVILVLPLAWEYATQHGWLTAETWRRGWWRLRQRWLELCGGAVVVMAVPLGLLTYMAYLWHRFGDPLAFVTAAKTPEWGRQTMAPWQTIRLYLTDLAHQPAWGFWQLHMIFEAAVIVLFVVLTIAAVRILPISFTLFTVGLLILTVCSPTTRWEDPLMSSGRYLVAAIPVFIALAHYLHRRPAFALSVLFGGVILEGALASLWLSGAWLA